MRSGWSSSFSFFCLLRWDCSPGKAGRSDVANSNIIRFVVVLALCAIPLVQHNAYWLHVLSLALISAILALGLQLLVGMAGVVSLGQGAFYGIGAYTAAILAATWKLSFVLSMLCGGIVAAAASLLLIPIVRLKDSSLAVATLGFAIIVHLVFINDDWLTGGIIDT